MYMCNHFKAQEFVDPETFRLRGDKSWMLMDRNILIIMDIIREEIGVPITINNWLWGGARKWSGLRTTSSPDYIPYSQHSFGRAVDFLVNGYSADDVRDIIRDLFIKGRFPVKGIRLELGISWVHIDIANVDGIEEFYP